MAKNIAAEFAFIAGLCRHPDIYFDLQQFVSVDDFTSRAHQDFFIVLQRLLLGSTGDLIVTKASLLAEASALNMKDFYGTCHDGELLDACLDYEAEKKDVRRAFTQVKNETVKRSYAEYFKKQIKYLGETSDGTNDIVNLIDGGLLTLSNRLQGVISDDIILLPDRARDIIMELAESPGELGVPIGYPVWQRGIGHMRNGSVTFIAATAKAGKSQFGARAALEVSKYMPVLYCDSELNEMTQSVRTFGMFSEINYEILETGYWKSDRQRILADGYDPTFATQCQLARSRLADEASWNEFRQHKLFYKKMTGMTAREMLPFLRRWVMQNTGVDTDSRTPRCLIVWDYIKLARIDEVQKMGVGAHDIIGDTCMALHDFAEEFNLPILAFGQTNREMDISMNMIAGAKKIVELVDSISVFKRKDAEDLLEDPNGTHEMYIVGSRHGKDVSTHINFTVDLGIGKFTELGVARPRPQPQKQDNDDKKQTVKD